MKKGRRPIIIRSETTGGMGIGPMAVLPNLQRQGIGTPLVKRGNQELSARGCPFIIVLGHANCYPRF